MTDETTFGAVSVIPTGSTRVWTVPTIEDERSPIQVKEHAILDDMDAIWRRVLVLRACLADTNRRIAEARGLEAKRGAQLAELDLCLAEIGAKCRSAGGES